MSIFTIANGALKFGPTDSELLGVVIKLINDLIDTNGLSVEGAIDTLLNSQNGAEEELLKALKKWVSKNGSSKLADLLEPLNTLELASDSSRRKLGWPAKELSLIHI